jgi:heptosyltransferase-2
MNAVLLTGNKALPSAPRRIVVRGVNWLGDAVMTTPALLRLKERFPDARITLLTPEKLAPLWLHHPAVDTVITFGPHDGALTTARRVRDEAFDLGLVLPNSPRAALELWLARVPHRVGYRRPWRNWLLTCRVPAREGEVRMRKRRPAEIKALIAATKVARQETPWPPGAHHIHHYLGLAAALGANAQPLAPVLAVSAAELEEAGLRVGRLAECEDFDDAPAWLGVNLGAEYGPAKRWPAECFAAVANEVTRRTGARWLVLGGAKERGPAAEFCQAVRGAVSVAGRTTLRELMLALSCCRMVLTNDTGPMHVAAALGKPVVAIFGSTSPELTGPGLPGDTRHRILKANTPCAPCFLRECPVDFRCMRGISVESASRAVLELMPAPGSDRQGRVEK